jgi:hypothetical protein
LAPGDAYLERDQFRDVKRALAEWLDDEGEDARIDARVWDFLLDHPALLGEARRNSSGIAKVAQEYRLVLDLVRPRKPVRQPIEIGPDRRSRALAEITAKAAAEMLLGVEGFRQQALDDRLLAVEQISPWIESQASREGEPARCYLAVPVPGWRRLPFVGSDARLAYAAWLAEEADRVAGDLEAECPTGATMGAQALSYGAPGTRPRLIRIRGDGLLAQLKGVTSGPWGVGPRTGWSEEQAVAFVLSGWTPPLPKGRISVLVSDGLFPALSRIAVEVDPRLSPREVAGHYNRMRKSFLGGRDRPMDDKHLALAVFAQETITDGATWVALRERWNERWPRWRFATEDDPWAKRFALECRTAWTRITGAAWHRPRRRPAQQSRDAPESKGK